VEGKGAIFRERFSGRALLASWTLPNVRVATVRSVREAARITLHRPNLRPSMACAPVVALRHQPLTLCIAITNVHLHLHGASASGL